MTILGRGDLMPPRRRRSRSGRRDPALAVVAIVILSGLGYLGWRLFANGSSPMSTAKAHCHTPIAAVAPAKSSAVHVRVVNTTLKSGLAARTRRVLNSRGFHVIGIGNAHPTVANVVISYPGAGGSVAAAAAIALREQFAHATVKKVGGHGPLTVSIGTGFAGEASTTAAAAAHKSDEAAAHPQRICTANP